ncbi:MAG: hypothetical protein IJ828_06375 [Treponema sp.]|nr:hypothetical protein [Treponema sp.]
MNGMYDDLIDYQWLGSPSRPRMPLADRAKIFMPFAALRGYEEELDRIQKKVEKSHEPLYSKIDDLDTAW